jgi:hypothetical protein
MSGIGILSTNGIPVGDELKTLAERAWLAATDDFSFSEDLEPIAKQVFKVGFLVGLQTVGFAGRTRAVREAVRVAKTLANPARP